MIQTNNDGGSTWYECVAYISSTYMVLFQTKQKKCARLTVRLDLTCSCFVVDVIFPSVFVMLSTGNLPTLEFILVSLCLHNHILFQSVSEKWIRNFNYRYMYTIPNYLV